MIVELTSLQIAFAQVVNVEKCATYYEQKHVDAVVKTATVKFENVCKDTEVNNCIKKPGRIFEFRPVLLHHQMVNTDTKDLMIVLQSRNMFASKNRCLYLCRKRLDSNVNEMNFIQSLSIGQSDASVSDREVRDKADAAAEDLVHPS